MISFTSFELRANIFVIDYSTHPAATPPHPLTNCPFLKLAHSTIAKILHYANTPETSRVCRQFRLIEKNFFSILWPEDKDRFPSEPPRKRFKDSSGRVSFDPSEPSDLVKLAGCYKKGKGVGKDLFLASTLYHKAAEMDFPKGITCLGACYEKGFGVKKDPVQSCELYKRAIGLKNPKAFIYLGYCYLDGNGVEKSLSRARELFQEAVTLKPALGLEALGYSYDTEKQFEESFRYYKQAASLDDYPDPYSTYNLALCYLYGRGVEKNPAEGIRLLNKATELNDEDAIYLLGKYYEEGTIVEQDLEKADLLYKRFVKFHVARLGSPGAIFSRGRQYLEGDSAPMNCSVAVKFFEEAALHNHPGAIFFLGKCSANGEGIEENMEEAARHYHDAADLDHLSAISEFGLCCLHGKGIPKNATRAAKIFEKGVKLGSTRAKEVLAQMYMIGAGVEQNLQKASELIGASDSPKTLRQQITLHMLRKDTRQAAAFLKLAADRGYEEAKDSKTEMILANRVGPTGSNHYFIDREGQVSRFIAALKERALS